MARPIQYDLEAFLDNTTKVFLSKGIKNVSMAHILSETGFNRHSLYKLFENKDKLYKRAVTNYRDRFLCHGYKLLEDNPQGLSSIKKFFETMLSSHSPVRCLMVNTIAEYDEMDDAVKALAQTHFLRIEHAYKKNIEIGIEKNEIASSYDPKDIASYLVMTMQGLPVNTQLYGNAKVQKLVFSYLDGLKN